MNIPHSPFATRLSGSAKETELRIRSIFQWKKKRPPVVLIVLALVVIALCGSLVGFTITTPQQPDVPEEPNLPQLSMSVQYYDTYNNYIEIPTLLLPEGEGDNDAIPAINQALADLQEQYRPILASPEPAYRQCLLYPTMTDRYLNLVFYHARLVTDLNTAHVTSLVYDMEEERQVTLTDALALAGTTEQGLFDALSAQYDAQYAEEYPGFEIVLQNHVLEAFRMDADGQPVFYLTARSDDADDTVQDRVSGADNLYIWANGTFTRYEQHPLEYGSVSDKAAPLIPAGETMSFDAPLCCQWYFSGGQPKSGFTNAALTTPPASESPFPYLREVLNTLSPSTPLVIADIQDLDWNGKAATVVTAGNVTVTGDQSVLYTPGEPSAAPNPPHARDTIMYSMGVLFVDGCEPVELYRRVYPISNSEDSVSYLPPSAQSYQQLYSVTQYDANGQLTSCPVFMDHGGELNIRYFKYAPAYSLKDATGDGIPEFIFSLDCQSSLMSQYAVYQLTDGVPTRAAITASTYKDVLLGGKFIHQGTTTDLEEYAADTPTVRTTPTRFALLDLDADGQNEVVVWVEINSTAETLVLHEKYGTVYGYSFVYRGLMDLKADGTFSWSGSAFRNGTARLTFYGPEAVRTNITYCDVPISSDSSDEAIFVVDGAAATAEEFTAAITAQSAKPDAVWYDLTEDNINRLLP